MGKPDWEKPKPEIGSARIPDLAVESGPANATEVDRESRLEESRCPWSDYLLDPEWYFEQLEDVEATVISIFTAVPSLLFSCYEGNPQGEHWATVRLMMRVSHAFECLQRVGFCGNEFNIVVESDEFSHTLRIVPISDTMIAWLMNTLINEEWSADTTNAMLEYFGLDMTIYEQSGENTCAWPVAQILAIGLMSYSGSHMSDFRDKLSSKYPPDPVTIAIRSAPGWKSHISCNRLPLACLNDFIASPVWTFSPCRTAPSHESGYSILTSLRSLIDLWGPASAVYTDDTCERIARIDVERGAIVATCVYEHQPVRCHWYGWSESALLETHEFSESSMLLIGYSFGMQVESSSSAAGPSPTSDQVQRSLANTSSPTPDDLLTLQENTDCTTRLGQLGKIMKMSGTQTSLGSRERSWYLDGVTLNGGLSKIITGGASVTLKRRRAVVRKALLRQNWDGPEPRVDTLDVRLAVEISACTGNSQRIPLLGVFKLPNVMKYIYANNGLREVSKRTFFDTVDLGFQAFKTLWKVDQIFKEIAINIVRQVLHELDETNPAQDNGRLAMAWYAGVEPDGFLFHRSGNEWMKVLANSANEVALLVLSSRCLKPTYGESSCRALDHGVGTGLRTKLMHTYRMSRLRRHVRPESPPVLACQHNEIKTSTEDETRQKRLFQRLQESSSPPAALSSHRTLDNLTIRNIAAASPVTLDGLVNDAQSYERPLKAWLVTSNGHKHLKLPHIKTPSNRVRHIQIDKHRILWSGTATYEEDIRGERDQHDSSETVDVWMTG